MPNRQNNFTPDFARGLTMTVLPEPPIPPDADLRHMPSYMIDVQALLDSDLAAFGDPAANWFAVLSWCASLHQLPAGSLPDDDAMLAYIVRLGRDVRTWRKMRAKGALKGWVRHADGRLYHQVVTKKVLVLLEKSRAAKAATAAREARKKEQAIENTHSEEIERSSTDARSVTQESINRREGKGIEEKGNEDIDIALTGDSLPQDPPMEDFGGRLSDPPAPSPEPASSTNGQGSQQPARRKSAKSDDPEHPEFAEWWLQYPLKKARAEAAKRYSLIVSKGRATPADLLAGVMRYAAERSGQDPRYTKHPATWLNQGCWTDEAQPQQPDLEHPLLAGVRHFINSRSTQ